MASVGVKHIVYAKATESGKTISYSEGKVMAEAMKVDVKWDKAGGELYADDHLSESDDSVTGGKVTYGVNDLSLENQAGVLGHTYTEEDGLVEADSDTAPYVGSGFYGKKILHGIVSWVAMWICKVQFSQPDESLETKGKTTKFSTPSIEGKIMQASDGKFRIIKEFTTEAEALAWVDAKAGITSV